MDGDQHGDRHGDRHGRSQADLIRAFTRARESGEFEQLERAALDLPSGQMFGAHAGQLPALVHEAYRAAVAPASRCRLAGALAKVWAYSYEPERAVPFADEAVALARDLGQPELLVDALDVALLVHWGPDSFAQRLDLSAQLASAAGHVADPELRLSAHLWRLTTAWEALDVLAVQRQLRALDLLAEETGSVRMAFFATARRAMHALVTASLDRADELIARTSEIGGRCDEPDVPAVTHSLAVGRARRAGDTEVLRQEAAEILTESSPGELIDRQALDAYRSRLRDLDEELAEAQSWADEARLSRLSEEREALLDEIAAATGLGGRQRRFSSADERARVAVRKAIAAALARIEQHDPATARLLKDTVSTGATCRYDPDPARPVTWLLD